MVILIILPWPIMCLTSFCLLWLVQVAGHERGAPRTAVQALRARLLAQPLGWTRLRALQLEFVHRWRGGNAANLDMRQAQ